MQGWRILVHSARMILNNWQAALRISAFLFVVQFASAIILVNMAKENSGLLLLILIIVLTPICLISFFWSAIGWHRFVLARDVVEGIAPEFNGNLITAYFGKTCIILLISITLFFIAYFILGALNGVLIKTGIWLHIGIVPVFFIASVIVGFFIFFRLSPILPAAALGQSLRLRDAWASTKGASATILVVLGGSWIVAFVAQLLQQNAVAIMIIFAGIFGWISMIFNFSILTTIYGHFVEGRELT